MNLKAKPIVKNEYWVITDGTKKVGNVTAEGSGFDVRIGNNIEHYDSTKQIEKKKQIEFEKTVKVKTTETVPPFAVYPTTGNRTYNSMLDVKRKLHLFTVTPKSKCFLAAGWFAIQQGDTFVPIFCPKYIFIQRYEYYGPFKTESEAKKCINSL
jgi:hypothetical protein